MKFRRIEPKSLLSILQKRLVIFLTIANMVIIILFGIGNYQIFLADTQLLLLRLLLNINILIVLSSGITLLIKVVQKETGTFGYIGYGSAAIFSILLSISTAFLLQMTKGFGN